MTSRVRRTVVIRCVKEGGRKWRALRRCAAFQARKEGEKCLGDVQHDELTGDDKRSWRQLRERGLERLQTWSPNNPPSSGSAFGRPVPARTRNRTSIPLPGANIHFVTVQTESNSLVQASAPRIKRTVKGPTGCGGKRRHQGKLGNLKRPNGLSDIATSV